MATQFTLTPRFPSTRLAKYPHLLASDIPIWDRFLDLYSPDFTGFNYDVRVGRGIEPPQGTSPNIRRMAIDLTQKRIDSVGFQPGKIWIIEVKERPGVGAVGQIISYTILFRKQFSPQDELIPAIVADIVEPDIRTILNDQGVTWFEV